MVIARFLMINAIDQLFEHHKQNASTILIIGYLEALEIIVKYSNLFDFHQLVISSQIGSIEKTCVSQALQKVNKMNDEFNSTSMINNEKRTSAAKLVNQ
ncbi:unnamed protein product [Rotaria sp. Silwood1]|nr:unnamed protein product [Rotaria sp. Silwood1]